MKKKLFFISLVLSGAIVSCKGDFDCECTSSTGDTEVAASYENVSKSDAKESCKSFGDLVATLDPGASCEIKKK